MAAGATTAVLSVIQAGQVALTAHDLDPVAGDAVELHVVQPVPLHGEPDEVQEEDFPGPTCVFHLSSPMGESLGLPEPRSPGDPSGPPPDAQVDSGGPLPLPDSGQGLAGSPPGPCSEPPELVAGGRSPGVRSRLDPADTVPDFEACRRPGNISLRSSVAVFAVSLRSAAGWFCLYFYTFSSLFM